MVRSRASIGPQSRSTKRADTRRRDQAAPILATRGALDPERAELAASRGASEICVVSALVAERKKRVTSSRHQNTTLGMRNKTAGAFLLASIAACGVVGDENIETSTDENELYGLGDAAPSWGDMNGAYVPICWANA